VSDDPRYKTGRWRKLRALKLKREPLCHYCAQVGRTTPADTVDHAMPTTRGGEFFDWSNLRSACRACNFGKGDKNESEFLAKGCDSSGWPLSPNHPWNTGNFK
jgi:5-methylcytosine-specific restriction endonuclease McrA